MKLLLLTLLLLPFSCLAEEQLLAKHRKYTVPADTFWLVKGVEPSVCDRICTSDIYISGELANVEINGLMFHGVFEFSFISKDHPEIKIYPETEVSLGDSGPELIVTVLKK